jgi:hypothetical protein
LALVLLSLAVPPAAAVELPGRDEYAFGFSLTLAGDSEFFAAAVPLEVYRSVADTGLRDAGVYNAAGQPVPRIFEHPAEPESRELAMPLGIVPLYGDQASEPDQLRLLLRRDADGTVLELDAAELAAQAGPGSTGERALTAYIVDARDIEQRLEALSFSWPPRLGGFIGAATVEDSNDLRQWRPLGAATLAELGHELTEIRQDRVELLHRPADFIRITWAGMPGDFSLAGVDGLYSGDGESVQRQWATLDPVAVETGEQAYLFDLGGFPPVDRVNLLLPDENVVVRADILYREPDGDRWRHAETGLFYHIKRQGNEVRSEPAAVRNIRAAHWRVRINRGATAGPVQLQLGWRPDRLLFVAQGRPPFELVTGRAADRIDQYPQQAVLGDTAIFEMLRGSGVAGDGTIGPRFAIAGAGQLSLAPAGTWRRALLWAGLSAAVLLVGWLTWSLARQLREAG